MSLLGNPNEIMPIIFNFMDLETMIKLRTVNSRLLKLINNYIKRIAIITRLKFKDFTSNLTNIQIVKRIHYLNNGNCGNLEGLHGEGMNIGKKIKGK